MKIAVTSQNRKNITEHAGRCRKFWVFMTDDTDIVERELLELPKEQSFHDSPHQEPHPLDDIDVLITAGMGQGMVARLARKNIKGVVTEESDPEQAVLRYLKGTLESVQPNAHHHEHK